MGAGMGRFFRRLLGLAVGDTDDVDMYARIIGNRTPEQALGFVLEAVQHHTHKSGALLGAQGIFVVVAIYALDHGWPRTAVLVAMLLLLVSSLLIMTTLLSTGSAFAKDPSEVGRHAFALLGGRIARYNIALYLTFASVILLAIGTFSVVGL